MAETAAIIYCRMSRDREGGGLGVDRQRADCQDLANRLGWSVVAVYEDNDISAYSGKVRPGYRSLLDDLRAGRAGAVIAWHTDRLHRSPRELEEYVDICDSRGLVTHTVKAGPLDLATPSGRMVARQLGAVARFEVEHSIERAQRAKLQAATAGRWKGGPRPFGYAADGVTVLKEEARAVADATDALLAGASVHGVARDWQARGLLTSRGKEWRPNDLRRVLLRPRNAGLMEHRGEIIGPASWASLVDEDRWRALVALLQDPRRRSTPGPARRWLGSGLYRCGVCGEAMIVTTTGSGRGGPRAVYRCSTRSHVARDAKHLDQYVSALVVERLSRPDVADLIVPTVAADTSGLHADSVTLRQRLDDLVTMYADGVIDGRQLAEGTGQIRDKLASIELQIVAATEQSALTAFFGPRDAADVWGGLDLDRRRAVLAALLTVTVHPGKRGRLPGGVYFDPDAVVICWEPT